MKTFRHNLAIAGVVIGLFCAASPAGETSATATVNVTITVMPYASVTLSQQTPLTVTISEGQTNWSVAVGGTVLCNCPVSLSAAITPPAGAPIGWTWTAATKVAAISTPGSHDYTSAGNKLLTVTVTGNPSPGGFDLAFTGQGLPGGSTPATPAAGYVVVTVMPQ
jgi:hypothetical protein